MMGRMWRGLSLPFCLLLVILGRAAHPACLPTNPVRCKNCFAVFVMPDTQNYTLLGGQPARGNHLDLVTRYVCENRSAFTEPGTGKQMPILMVIQLGDIVQSGDFHERGNGGGPLAQWVRADAAFDNLDSCVPKVPYLVTVGNHDLAGYNYEGDSVGYNTYFGVDRFTSQGYGCAAPDDCAWDEGRWFIGGGDPVVANSRNQQGGGSAGPSTTQPGRHRAASIVAPNGQRFLFLGLELAFDYPPEASSAEGDDLAWPKKILDLYPQTPTIVFHHSLFWAFEPPDDRPRFGPEVFHSDSLTPPEGSPNDPDYGTRGGMKELYDQLIEPRPQVRFVFSGHVLQPTHQADFTIPRKGAPPVFGFLRNYQNVDMGDGEKYGAGWNAVAVFDPDAGQVRVRSYRIDDEEAYADPPVNLLHQGTPVPTECMDMDQRGFPERVIPWNFGATAPGTPSLQKARAARVTLSREALFRQAHA